MDLLGLRYFSEVVQQQNLTKAAALLGTAQPALTRRIHQMEEEFGTTLLVRHRRGVRPTEAGLIVFERARLLLKLAEEMRGEVSSRTSEPHGQIRFGYPPSLGDLFLAELVARYSGKFPRVSFLLDEQFSPALKEELLTGRIDLGIMTCEATHPDLHLIPLFAERLWFIGRTVDWPFRTRSLSPVRLARRPILIASFLRKVLETDPAYKEARLDVRIEADGLATLRQLVRSGSGFLLGPPSSVSRELDSGEFSGAPIKGLQVTRGLFRHKNRPITRAMHELEFDILQASKELLRRPSMFKTISR